MTGMKARPIEMIPLIARRKSEPFDFVVELTAMLDKSGASLRNGDVLVVSGKFLAMAEGRYVDLGRTVPLHDAVAAGSRFKMSPALAETVIREADHVLKGLHGFMLTIKEGAFAPNAGVDKSNIPKGKAILHPSDPNRQAALIRREVLLAFGAQVGVVVTDSRLQPLRRGTVGVTIGFSGIDAVVDDRGREDLFGNRLKVTRRAVADDLSSAAQLLMGESDETVPIVVVRGKDLPLADLDGYDVSVDPDECIFVRGLANYGRTPSQAT